MATTQHHTKRRKHTAKAKSSPPPPPPPDYSPSSSPKVVIAAGTYDGVLAGWEFDEAQGNLAIRFASPVHGGSVRSLSFTTSHNSTNSSKDSPGLLLSCGYDEMLRLHDFCRHVTCSGEIRTPGDFGTPVVSAFAPPHTASTTEQQHCVVGFSSGKLAIYSKKDWVIQHVLDGHVNNGIGSLAVHPSGKLALTGGVSDGKLKLWDLTTGRLAHVNKIPPASTSVSGRTHYESIVSIVWGSCINDEVYAFCCGSHVTVRDVATGKELLDVDLPSRVNQICLLCNPQGIFVVAACNDGSLPVLAVKCYDGKDQQQVRRAIMAIEPVDGTVVAGDERFKCVQAVSPYHVVTANSAGVISLMSLQGAVNMILTGDNHDDEQEEDAAEAKTLDKEETPVHADSDDGDGGHDEEDFDVEEAVHLIDSIQLGTGARITCLAAWSCLSIDTPLKANECAPVEATAAATSSATLAKTTKAKIDIESAESREEKKEGDAPTRKRGANVVVMDPETLEKARDLVSKAKKIQKRKHRKKHKVEN